ncbi:MAG: PQQ-binding-like beta-propeller repeat protein [Pseudomonadales bacterium]|nr:PQQ-binding-like beta-propeller repeat protein [Pseudomonadales bacterium]
MKYTTYWLIATVLVTVPVPVAVSAEGEYGDWPSYASSLASTKYAPFSQINSETIGELGISWVWESVDNEAVKVRPDYVPAGYKSTPIKVGGVLYTSTSLGSVAALDAVTGRQLWTFDTKTWEDRRPANMGFNHRGVSYYEDGETKRILMGTNNAYLWSLNAATGKPDPTFGDGGKIDLTLGLGRPVTRSLYSNTAAPMIVGDIVVMGAVVGDAPAYGYYPPEGYKVPPGHVRGFDVKTGKMRWIFHSVPRAGEVGAATWKAKDWTDMGAANVWTSMSADPELGYVYLPFGTAENDFYGGDRPGDNLFSESLVCLDAATGKRVWHFQMVHHGVWDYDLAAAPNLVDIVVNGKSIKAVAQVSKQGFIYVFNRVNGEPIWPIEERSVPQSTVPGENLSPTQPFPTKPKPFDWQGISEDILIDFTPELRAEALQIISRYDVGPLFTPPSLRGSAQLPSDAGGANWTGAAVDPETGSIYIPSMTLPAMFKLGERDPSIPESGYKRTSMTFLGGPQGLPLIKPPYGRVTAIDLNTGEHRWMVPNGEGLRKKLIAAGIADPGPVGNQTFTNILVTKSLLFIALVDDGKPVLRALDKRNGALVREIPLPAAPGGAPMTYLANGKQYISVPVGGATDAQLITLSIGGNLKIEKKILSEADQLRRPDGLRVAQLYGQVCATCHENAVKGAARAGDISAWKPRLEKGIQALYENTINGMGEMPPRGGCGNTCTDGDLMSLVDFVVGTPD